MNLQNVITCRDSREQPLAVLLALAEEHMISQEERGEAQPREPQGHRLPLPVGEEPVSAAGADDNGGAQPLPAQLRKVVGGVCNQLRGAVRIGDGQRGRWPVPQRQLLSAVAYVRDNWERYHVDPHAVVVMGFSAGAQGAEALQSSPGAKTV